MNRFQLIIASLFVGMSFTSCHDDDPEINYAGDVDVAPIEFPTEDVISNTYSGNYAIVGTGDYDEATRYVLNRLTGTRYSYSPTGDYVADDVRLVFLNNESLLNLERPMVEQMKKVVDNGGYIYVHKPNSLALAFLAIAIYGDIDEAMNDLKQGMQKSRSRAESDEPMTYDSFIMGPNNRQLCLMDIYDGKATTIEVTNPETGDVSTEEYLPQMPDPYEYGRFAENIMEWLNENTEPTGKSIFSRASGEVLDNASDMKVIVPCNVYSRAVHKKESKTYDKSFDASLRVWISNLYNFDKDEDYYHVVLEETFDGSQCYAGQWWSVKIDKVGHRSKYAGFPYTSLYVKPSFQNTSGRNGTLKDAWNPQPENEGVTSTVENVSGWSINSQVGYSGGFAALFSGDYKNEQTVTTIDKSITPRLRDGSSQNFYWDYKLTDELYYKKKSGDVFYLTNCNLHEPSKNSLTINTCRTRQSWNWLVSGTKDRGNDPFTLSLDVKFMVLEASALKSFSSTLPLLANKNNQTFTIDLPVPNRIRMAYSMSCENAVLSEWAALKEEIISHDRENFAKLNSTRCAPTEQLVDQRTADLWNKTIEGVARRISTFNHLEKDKYVIVLKNNNGKIIGKKLIVTATGARVE